jgi:PAS domain S-box-containing protein
MATDAERTLTPATATDAERTRGTGADATGLKLDALLRTAGAAVHADYAWVDLDQRGLRVVAASTDGEALPDVTGIAHRARRRGGQLTIGNLQEDDVSAEPAVPHELGAVLALPLELDGKLVGSIGVADRLPRSWANDDTLLLSALASAAEAIVEVEYLQRVLAGRTRESLGLIAQNIAIRTLADAASIDDGLARLLADVAPVLGFNAGACWLADDAQQQPALRCCAFWSDLGEATHELAAATRSAAFVRGAGMPGKVWARARPVWIEDLGRIDTASAPRLAAAERGGLRAALAFPIMRAGDVFGVIELFSAAPIGHDQEVLDGLVGFGTQVVDFIERKRTEARLVESEARFRILSETAADAIFTMDEASTIQYVNPAVERIFGYAPQELIGKNLTVLIPERLRVRHRAGVQRHAATGERHIPWAGVQLPGRHRSGRELPLEISFGEYRRHGTHVYTGIVRDISERIAQQDALRQQAEQLEELASELERSIEELEEQRDQALLAREEADRSNRAKSEFLAVMSHELRTPLNAIMGYTDLLDAGIPEPIPPGPRQKVERIRFSARHLLALIDEVLMYTRLEAGGETPRIETFSLRTLLDDVSGVIEPLALAKGLRYERIAPPDPGTLESDVQRIRQILINLLGNAVKFTEQGKIRLCLEREDGAAVFSVEDSGIGIAPEDLDAIFAAFWQAQRSTTRSVGGTGLGLSVSRRLARLLGGDVTVRSTLGQGSTFTLRLPPFKSRNKQIRTDRR